MALAPPGEGTPATPAPTLARTGTDGTIDTKWRSFDKLRTGQAQGERFIPLNAKSYETAAANAGVTVLAAKPPEPRSPARYLWAMLIARIYEVFPLVCLHCAGQMRIIAFILDAPTVRKILDHIGEDSRPRRITPARGPPLCDEFDVALAAREDARADAHQELSGMAPVGAVGSSISSRSAHRLVRTGEESFRARPGVSLRAWRANHPNHAGPAAHCERATAATAKPGSERSKTAAKRRLPRPAHATIRGPPVPI